MIAMTITATTTHIVVLFLPPAGAPGADGGWLAGGGVPGIGVGSGVGPAGAGDGGVSVGAGGVAVGVGVGVPEGSISFPLLLMIFYTEA